MIKERVTYCHGCGLTSEQAGKNCSRCHYPLDAEKEEQFLRSEIDQGCTKRFAEIPQLNWDCVVILYI